METAPIREMKPVVVPAQFYVLGPILSAFVALFPASFVFVISNMIQHSFDPVFGYGIAAYIMAFIVCMILFAVKVFNEPSWTTYSIFTDRIEYDDGIWNRHRRTLLFDQVIGVELTEGVLQQTQGAGTVTLVTKQLVSLHEGRISNLKISLGNVPQPKEVYDLIRSLTMKKGTE